MSLSVAYNSAIRFRASAASGEACATCQFACFPGWIMPEACRFRGAEARWGSGIIHTISASKARASQISDNYSLARSSERIAGGQRLKKARRYGWLGVCSILIRTAKLLTRRSTKPASLVTSLVAHDYLFTYYAP